MAVVPLDIEIKKTIGVCRWEASEGSCPVFFLFLLSFPHVLGTITPLCTLCDKSYFSQD